MLGKVARKFVEIGLLDEEQARSVEARRKDTRSTFISSLRRLQLLPPDKVAEGAAAAFELEFWREVPEGVIDEDAVAEGGGKWKELEVVPLKGGRAAAVDPGGYRLSRKLVAVIPSPALAVLNGKGKVVMEVEEGEGSSYRKLLEAALKMGASDLHLEPGEDGFRVRVRVDGVLRDLPVKGKVSEEHVNSLVTAAEQDSSKAGRTFLDGRLKVGEVDVRLSVVPSIHGPAVVCRFLVEDEGRQRLEELGYPREQVEAARRMAAAPHGLVLVCGPTGSGKSTTLHAMVREVCGPEVKVLAVEDPVEVPLPAALQVEVNELAGVTFGKALRAFMRHDPDVILVGEIRDEETAAAAIRAAQTGHLVLATLHVNSVLGAPTRLVGLGVSQVELAEEWVGGISQRLVRRLCGCWKGEKKSIEDVSVPLPPEAVEAARSMGVGEVPVPGKCEKCGGTGYSGRTVVAEVLEVSPALARVVAEGGDLAKAAEREGFRCLQERGVGMVKEGVTSFEELQRVCGVVQWLRWRKR